MTHELFYMYSNYYLNWKCGTYSMCLCNFLRPFSELSISFWPWFSTFFERSSIQHSLPSPWGNEATSNHSVSISTSQWWKAAFVWTRHVYSHCGQTTLFFIYLPTAQYSKKMPILLLWRTLSHGRHMHFDNSSSGSHLQILWLNIWVLLSFVLCRTVFLRAEFSTALSPG